MERLRLPRVVITTSALQSRADSEEKKLKKKCLRGKMLERKKSFKEKDSGSVEKGIA